MLCCTATVSKLFTYQSINSIYQRRIVLGQPSVVRRDSQSFCDIALRFQLTLEKTGLKRRIQRSAFATNSTENAKRVPTTCEHQFEMVNCSTKCGRRESVYILETRYGRNIPAVVSMAQNILSTHVRAEFGYPETPPIVTVPNTVF